MKHRSTKRAPLLALLFACVFALSFGAGAAAQDYPNYNLSPLAPDASGMASTATELAARMRLGWNAGNSLEATGGETAWGNPRITRELIRAVKAQGFSTVRIPASWDQHANAATAAIDPAWLARVREVVQYCIDEDMFVILNVHWDGGWLERHVEPQHADDVNARQRAFWQQIATHFRDYDEHVLFASANEPHVENAAQMAVLHRYHQTFVNAVRETGGRNSYRVLVVQGPSTDIEKTDNLWQAMPNDPVASRLMLEVHYYTPWNFAGLERDESWGRQFYYWGADYHSRRDADRNASWGEERDADALFARMRRKFVDAGVPVIIGEFGAIRRSNLSGEALALHERSRAYYLEYVARVSLANGMVPVYWDNGHTQMGSGIFDRANGGVSDPQALAGLRKGAGLQ